MQKSGFSLFSERLQVPLSHSTSSVGNTSSLCDVPSWFRNGQDIRFRDPDSLELIVIETAPLTPGFYSYVYVVTKSGGGYWPSLDLSVLNRYVHSTKFRMEIVRTVMSVIWQGDWMVSIDLRDAYFQVPEHQDRRKFLRFSSINQPHLLQVLLQPFHGHAGFHPDDDSGLSGFSSPGISPPLLLS